jgi:hypothetical protein
MRRIPLPARKLTIKLFKGPVWADPVIRQCRLDVRIAPKQS